MRRAEPTCLYPSESELAKLVLGEKASPSDWKAKVAVLEKSGFPIVDPLMGGRYWPSVRAWLDRWHGLSDKVTPAEPHYEESLT